MKNTKINKFIIFIATLLLITLTLLPTIALAGGLELITAVPTGQEGKIRTIGGMILGVVQVIGVAVAVIILVVLAMKYMTASPGEKADIKKSAFIYVVGALLLFGGVAFLNIIQSAGRSIERDTAGSSWFGI